MRKLSFILAITVAVVFSFLSVDGHAKKPSSAGAGSTSLSDLSCAADQIAKFDGTVWVCAADDTGSGGLNDLSCQTDEIAKFDGAVWVCAADNTGPDSSTAAAAVPDFVLRDGNGVQVGTVLSVLQLGIYEVHNLVVFFNSNADEHKVIFSTSANNMVGGTRLYFDGDRCSGNKYLRTDHGFLPAISSYALIPNGTDLNMWLPASNTTQMVETKSYSRSGGSGSNCILETVTYEVLPAEIGVTDLHTLYPPPFTLEIL